MHKLIATLAAGAAAVGLVGTATTATAEPPARTTIDAVAKQHPRQTTRSSTLPWSRPPLRWPR